MNLKEIKASKHDIQYQKAIGKAKTNLLWFALFSIVMFFAGITSAFIVSRGNGFWVSLQLPPSLIISTILIIISSITMVIVMVNIKKNKQKASTLFLVLTFVFGILFSVFQIKGWGEIYKKGYAWTGTILNPNNSKEFFVKGEYGKDFTLFYGTNELILEKGNFYYWGEKNIKIDKEEFDELNASKPDLYAGSKFIKVKKEKVKSRKTKKLITQYNAVIVSKIVLSENQKAKLAEQRNTSSSYFYVLTGAHLLHIIGALIYLLVMIFGSIKGRFSNENYLQLKLGGYFWHFLGGLWLYLFFFLYYIH